MKLINKNTGLAFFVSLLSFGALLAMILLSNPLQDVSYALYFFGLLLILLVSLGYLVLLQRNGKIAPRSSYKIFVSSGLIVILAMFKSAGSLGVANIAIIILLVGGLIFYFNRRS